MKWINQWKYWVVSMALVSLAGTPVLAQTFTNVAAANNVDLTGNKDGGVCWADFNNDGFLDLVVNTNENGFASRSRLYFWNSATNQFDDVTTTNVSTQFNDRRERSALAGDFDNDGDLDFMRSTSTQLEIYENSGAPNYNLNLMQEFTSGTAPFDGTTQNGMNNEGLAWMDFDGDGDLDVYMEDHQYGQDILEYNELTGFFEHFTPDSDPKGFPTTGSSGDYSVTADLDNDGYVDIVARREGTNTSAPTGLTGYDIFFNDGDGTFSFNNTVNLQTSNSYKGGVAVADFDNDGDFDYMWTNHDDGSGSRDVVVVEQTGLNTRVFQIATVTVTAGITGSLTALPDQDIEGIAMADINNDGKVDVFLAADSGPSYLLVNNNTGGNFSFIHENYGINVNADGEGLAFADYDDDGDMDFYLNIRNGANQLWENDLSGDTDYLKVEPLIDLGGGITRPAIGATVVVDEEGCSALKFIQEVSGGVGHGAQNDSRLHFGLPGGPNLRYKVTVSYVRPNGGARTVVEKYVTPSALTGQTLQVLDTDTSDPNASPVPQDDSFTVTMNSTNNALDVLDNDSDPNGENLTLNLPSATSANGGTITVNDNGTAGDPTDDFIDYTPANGFNGVDNFDYEVINTSLFCQSASVTITVNAPPTGADNAVTTDEDITYTFQVSDFTNSYNDADGDAFAEIRITSLETVGNLLYNGNPVTLNQVINATDIGNGLLTFVPVAGQSGSPYDTFDFEVGDGTDFSTADYTLTVNVNAVNDAPSGADNTVTTNEDITYTFQVADFTVGYSDPEGDGFAEIRITSLESVGNLLYNGNPVTLNQVVDATDIGNGLLTFVPVANQSGSPYDTFDFEVGDGTDFSASDYTLTVNVNPINDAPTGADNTVTTDEDVTYTFQVADFTVSYSDQEGTPFAEIRITSLESVGNLLYNGNPVTLNQVINATDIGNGLLTFVPVAGQSGSPYDTFDFEVGDGTNFSTAAYTLTVNVNAVNDAPSGADNTVTTNEDITYTFQVADFTVSYSDPEGTPFAEIRITSLESVGNLLYNGNPVTLNQVIDATDIGNGLLTFVPIANQNGSPYDSFDFEVGDGTDFSISDYTLTINVTAINDAPTAANTSVTTSEDVTYTFQANDFNSIFNDVDGDALAEIRITSLESVGNLLYNGNPVTLNQVINITDITNGLLTFVPIAGQNGSPYDTFDFEVGDGTDFSATDYTLTINVNAVNDVPVGSDNSITINEDATYTFQVADFTVGYSDPEGDAFAEIRITSLESVGNLLYNGNPVTLNQVIDATDIGNGLLTFVPVTNGNGSPYDSFDFEVGDGTGFSASDYTMTINVTAINDAPTAADNSVTTNQDVTYTFQVADFSVSYNDAEGDALAEIRITGLESVGSLLYNGNPVTLNQVIDVTDITNGLLTFVPVAGQSGSPYDTFDFEVGDGTDFSTTDYTLTVNVTPQNDPPLGADNTVTTDEDVTYTFLVADFSVGYSDPDGNPLAEIRITSLEAVGNLLYNGNPVTLNQVIDATDIGNGLLTFVPLAGQSGAPYDNFDFEVGDGIDFSVTDYTITINVNDINDVPNAVNDNAVTNQDVAVNISAFGNDNLGDAPTTVTSFDTNSTQGGTVTLNDNGTPGNLADDFFTYTPPSGFFGSDSFTYTIEDSDGESNTGTVNITVNNVNDVPLAVDDVANTTQDVAIPIAVLNNDQLGDEPTQISGVDAVSAQGGSASIDDNGTPGDPSDDFIQYTPAAGFSGTDSFDYTIEDADGETSTATVVVTVNAIGNNNPIAQDDNFITNLNTPLSIAPAGVLANDNDADSDPLTVIAFDAVSTNGGTVVVNADGSFDYTPAVGFTGVDNFTYTISDGNGGSATASVSIDVQAGVNSPPVIIDITLSTIINLDLNLSSSDFLSAFSDADGDPLNQIQILSLPTDGSLLLSGVPVTIGQFIPLSELDNLVFSPDAGFTGSISFQWTTDDGKDPATSPAQVNINIPFDSDGDGIPDEEEIGGDSENPRDTDGDGDPDFNDPDSDNDGINDDEEAGDDPENPVDTDMDGDPDYIDDDSDGDGKLDEDEGTEDCDGDGIENYLDPEDDCEELTIYKGFSPNGDGNNDQWVIDGILDFPQNEVRVFNRWGNLVYEETGYDNQSKVWFGQTNQGIVLGKKDLPDGTYFYMVELGDGSEVRSGYVMLKR